MSAEPKVYMHKYEWKTYSPWQTPPETKPAGIPMILHCPECGTRHVDRGEFETKAHHTHACQSCGFVWRPAIVATAGVQFLPGFKDRE